MFRTSFIVLFLLLGKIGIAQSFAYPVIASEGKSVADFIPNGWAVLDSTSGDLNGDRISDMAVVLQCNKVQKFLNDGDTTVAQPRILIVLFKQGNAWKLAEQSNTFILMHDNPNMDDPFESLVINNGNLNLLFRLWYSMGSWYITKTEYEFKYEKGDFNLISAFNYSLHRATADFEELHYNFIDGKFSVSKGNEESGKAETKWYKLPEGKLKTLKELEKPYEWNIVDLYYL